MFAKLSVYSNFQVRLVLNQMMLVNDHNFLVTIFTSQIWAN